MLRPLEKKKKTIWRCWYYGPVEIVDLPMKNGGFSIWKMVGFPLILKGGFASRATCAMCLALCASSRVYWRHQAASHFTTFWEAYLMSSSFFYPRPADTTYYIILQQYLPHRYEPNYWSQAFFAVFQFRIHHFVLGIPSENHRRSHLEIGEQIPGLNHGFWGVCHIL